MNTRTTFCTIFIAFLVIAFCSFAFGQYSSETNKTKTQQVEESEANIRQVMDKSGRAFKEGLLALKDNRRSVAGGKFNESLEVFLLSQLNVQSNESLSSCYNQLIETIYRIEFRTNQAPNIRSLVATCNWDITNELADQVSYLVVNTPNKTNIANDDSMTQSTDDMEEDVLAIGFDEQKFIPSPFDELAELQLTEEEVNPQYNVNVSENERKNCETLTSPVIQKLQLGMNSIEVSQKLSRRVRPRKVSNSVFPNTTYSLIYGLKGIENLFLSFYKGKLYGIDVYYDDSIKWNGVYEFQRAVSNSLDLPNNWVGTSKKTLYCNNFSISFKQTYSNKFILSSTDRNAIRNMLKEFELEQKRRKEREEKKKKTFKP